MGGPQGQGQSEPCISSHTALLTSVDMFEPSACLLFWRSEDDELLDQAFPTATLGVSSTPAQRTVIPAALDESSPSRAL